LALAYNGGAVCDRDDSYRRGPYIDAEHTCLGIQLRVP
jgi:hypothetical protein